ncbi:MAG: prolyl oligopeptidase family serine peptidase [Acidobacteriota bacterium]
MSSDSASRSPQGLLPRLLAALVATGVCAGVLWASTATTRSEAPHDSAESRFPESRRDTVVDTYHGVRIADPYRWLEDLESAETHTWMASQEKALDAFLDDERVARLEAWIEALGETGARVSAPIHAAGRYFYTERQPGQDHGVVQTRRGLEGRSQPVLDPNRLLRDGQSFNGFSVSSGGRYLVYTVSEAGSRWGRARILDVESGETLPSELDGVRGAATVWLPGDRGFFYLDFGSSEKLRRGEAEPLAQLRYYAMDGASESPDPVVFERPEQPSWLYAPAVSRDGKTLILTVYEGTQRHNRVLVADLSSDRLDRLSFRELLGDGEHAFRYVGSRGDRLYFYTNHQAPNGRIVRIDRSARDQRFVEVVPEQGEILAGGSSAGGNAMNLIGERLVLLYRRVNVGVLRVFGLDGAPQHERVLEAGWIGSGLVGDDGAPGEAWYTFDGFVTPSTVFRLDLESGAVRPFIERPLPIEPDDYVLANVHYASQDGTRVPLFIAHRRGLERDGKRPVFMYGYGFGGWAASPWYQPSMLAWVEMGGIYVLPGVRGGGEYGDGWRDAGIRLNRQNAIDDYIAAAEWLVAERYTAPGRIGANGWSASGSLAAAAVLQRPDLFGAALIGIPSLDLLRYQHFTAFSGWTRGYGSSDDPEEFAVLRRISPYHNIPAKHCTPPMLVTVGEHDETTPPMHGYKFVAALQHQPSCARPAYLKIVRGAGHGFGTNPAHRRRTFAEELAFLTQALSMPLPG